MFSFLTQLPRRFLVGLVRAYQLLSAQAPPSCRFVPSCSEYAQQALEKYGALKGTILTGHRLLRCHPWGGHGYDPPRWYGEPLPGERHPHGAARDDGSGRSGRSSTKS